MSRIPHLPSYSSRLNLSRDVGALLATRRKRSEDEGSVWAAHVVVVDGDTVGDLQYETDRARFLGRARDLRDPVSVMDGRPLSKTVGSVLDPIFSLRRTVRVPPGSTVRLIFSTIAAATREEAARSRRQISRCPNLRTDASLWLGRRHRFSCITSESARKRRSYSSVWRTPSCT